MSNIEKIKEIVDEITDIQTLEKAPEFCRIIFHNFNLSQVLPRIFLSSFNVLCIVYLSVS